MGDGECDSVEPIRILLEEQRAFMGLTPEKSYEDALGDGLEILLKQEKTSLAEIVDGLNELNVRGPNGKRWTPDLLKSELARLAP